MGFWGLEVVVVVVAVIVVMLVLARDRAGSQMDCSCV